MPVRFPALSPALLLAFSSQVPVAHPADAEPSMVIVTAARMERPLAEIGNSVTLIEPDDIRASQKLLASDLLSFTPGVTASRNGGPGATTSLRIRGAEGEQTVVLFDGVKLNDPSSPGGGYNFANLVLDDISRIEVLRGPQSTLWGSQAIGGVVNVVTPLPDGPLSGALTAEGGARGSAYARGRLESGGDRHGWRIGASYLATDGISAFDEDRGGAEDDAFRNFGASGRFRFAVSDSLSLDLRSVYSESRNDFDGFPPPLFAFSDTPEYGETAELVAYAGLRIAAPGGRWTHRLGFSYTDTDRQNFDPGSAVRTTFDAQGENQRLEYQGTVALSRAFDVVFGVESERSDMSTAAPSTFDPDPVPLERDVRLDSAYAQLQASPLEALSLTAGVRRDDHDEFGGNTTASASVAWSVAETTILRASYGEGFKAPTLYQLYSEFGNAALQPEDGEGWDAGIERRFLGGALVLVGTYFERDTINMIDFVSCFLNPDPRCGSRPFGFYDNVQRTEASGVELSLVASLGERMRLGANYTHLSAENSARGTANFGRELPRRPQEVANAELTYAWPFGLESTVAVQYVGSSFDNASNTAVLDEYTLIDLRIAYELSEQIQLYGRLENAFDEDYETTARYGAVGRGAFAGVRVRF